MATGRRTAGMGKGGRGATEAARERAARPRSGRLKGRCKVKRLLVVNMLPEDDPAVSPALEALGGAAEELQVIHAREKNLRPCSGCNACWLVTPGVCSIQDGYEELLKAYLACDAAVFLSGTALNFVDFRMKNAVDRLLPLATMYIHIVDGQCRHVPRYDRKLRFGLLYAGAADGAYLNRWMERVMLNLGGESLGTRPIFEAKELFVCI